MIPCPTEEILSQFLEDRLVEPDSSALSQHVDTCEHCQTRLDRLTTDDASIVGRIQNLSSVIHNGAAATPVQEWSAADTQVIGNIRAFPSSGLLTLKPDIPGYTVEEELGRGGMGVVYRARHKRLNRPVALKMVLAGAAADPRTVQRFLFEGEVLARIRHPHVVQVYEVSMYQGPTGVAVPFLAMELLEGGSLGTFVAGQKLAAHDAAKLVEGLARAVHATHQQGIVHRDLKPSNILRTSDGEFKVTDFGLAKFTSDSNLDLTGTGMVVGTPQYMAPEQASGAKQIGPAADVYSLGAMLYEMLTGKPPFTGTEPMSVLLRVINEMPTEVRSSRSDVPRDLAAVVMKCLLKDPAKRYPSAESLADDLQRFWEGRPTLARPLRRRDKFWLWIKRNPVISGLVALLFVVSVIGFGFTTYLWIAAEERAVAESLAKVEAHVAKNQAMVEFRIAQEQRQIADRRGAYLALEQALTWCEQGRLDQGMKGFVHALELAERINNPDLQRVIRINIQNWSAVMFPAGRSWKVCDGGDASAFCFSPDGQLAAIVGSDGCAEIYDVETGKRLQKLSPHSRSMLELGWDATLLMAQLLSLQPGRDFFNTATLAVVDLVNFVNLSRFRCVAFDQTGNRLTAGDSLGRAHVWDWKKSVTPKSWRADLVPILQSTDIWRVEFDPQGNLWTGGADGAARCWNVETGQVLRTFLIDRAKHFSPKYVARPDTVTCMKLNADGTSLFVGDRNRQVAEWDTKTGELKRLWKLSGWIHDLAFFPGEKDVLACGTFDSIFNLNRRVEGIGLQPERIVSLIGAAGNYVSVSPDARQIIFADTDGNVRLWDSFMNTAIGGPLRIEGGIHGIRMRPGSKTEFAVLSGTTLRMQSLSYPPAVPQPPAVPGLSIRKVQMCANQTQIAFILADHIRIHEAGSGNLLQEHYANAEILTFATNAEATYFYCGFRDRWGTYDVQAKKWSYSRTQRYHSFRNIVVHPKDGTVLVHAKTQFEQWDATGKELLRTFKLPGFEVTSGATVHLEYVNAGADIAVVIANRLFLLDSMTGKPRREPIIVGDGITSVATNANGKYLAMGYQNNTAQVWNMETGKPLFEVPLRHERAVSAVALNPEGTLLVTGCRDGTCLTWDIATGFPIGPKKRHSGPVTSVAWNLATACADGVVFKWQQMAVPVGGSLGELRTKFGQLKNNSLDQPEVE